MDFYYRNILLEKPIDLVLLDHTTTESQYFNSNGVKEEKIVNLSESEILKLSCYGNGHQSQIVHFSHNSYNHAIKRFKKHNLEEKEYFFILFSLDWMIITSNLFSESVNMGRLICKPDKLYFLQRLKSLTENDFLKLQWDNSKKNHRLVCTEKAKLFFKIQTLTTFEIDLYFAGFEFEVLKEIIFFSLIAKNHKFLFNESSDNFEDDWERASKVYEILWKHVKSSNRSSGEYDLEIKDEFREGDIKLRGEHMNLKTMKGGYFLYQLFKNFIYLVVRFINYFFLLCVLLIFYRIFFKKRIINIFSNLLKKIIKEF